MICVLSLVVGLAGFGLAISKIVRVGRQQQAEQKRRADAWDWEGQLQKRWER